MSDHSHPVDPGRVADARRRGIAADEAQVVGAVLSLLVDPLRMRILAALLEVDELCVGDLALALEVSEDAVSYALRILRTAGLVRRRRYGRMAFYRIESGEAHDAVQTTLSCLRDLARLRLTPGADDETLRGG